MVWNRIIITVITTLLMLTVSIQAHILNVPEDFETIQGAIDEAEDGDTVLVAPGEYVENIQFAGRDIVVASHFIIDGDEDFIAETIIDGDQNGSVVTFSNLGDTVPQLNGFTLRNGGRKDDSHGEGIESLYANPFLSNLVVTDNRGYSGGLSFRYSEATLNNSRIVGNIGSFGGGGLIFHSDISMQNVIFESNESESNGGGLLIWSCDPTLMDVIVRDNIAGAIGGGIRLDSASPTLTRVAIVDNVGRIGGGLETDFDSNPVLINVTIVGNESESNQGGGIDIGRSEVTMVNSIVWGNEPGNILNEGNFEAIYSDFEDMMGGEGNISEEPLFVDPDNGDYHLTHDSPCIDAGDPDSDPDLDGTRADMGAFPYLRRGVMRGTVLDHATDEPIPAAQITTDNGQETTTDDNGFFILPNLIANLEYDLTASAPGYNDSTLTDLRLGEDDTLEVEYRLLHPEFTTQPDDINVSMPTGESSEFVIIIENQGNGILEWTVEPRRRGEAGVDPWRLRRHINISRIADDDHINSVIFAENYYYVSGENHVGIEDGPDLIYVINRFGELVDSFLQPEEIWEDRSIKDMAWDGELIWGAGSGMIGGFTTEGELQIQFQGPCNPNSAIAWDPDRELLWISAITSDIYGIRRNGEIVTELDRCRFRIYGLAYWRDDPDGYTLYIFHNPSGDREQMVHKMNPDNGDTLLVRNLSDAVEGSAGGAFITIELDNDSWVFIDIANDGANDRIDVWQLAGITDWMIVDPLEGIIEAEQEQDIFLMLDATNLTTRLYEGRLLFRHNAAGGETSLTIDLTVIEHAVDRSEISIPGEFGITGVHPNPFNSSTTITYGLDKSAPTRLEIFDLSGRLVERLVDETLAGGVYSTVWQAEGLASGLYFVRLEIPGQVAYGKIMLIK